MNGRIKKSRLGHSVEYGILSQSEKITMLEKENQELAYEINDIRTTLDLNKAWLMDVISATTKEEQYKSLINTVNKLVKENVNLQNEVQRLQDEYLHSLKTNYLDTLREINPNKLKEESKNGTLGFKPVNVLDQLKFEEVSGEDSKSLTDTQVFTQAVNKTNGDRTTQVCHLWESRNSKTTNSKNLEDSKWVEDTPNVSSKFKNSRSSSCSGSSYDGSSSSQGSTDKDETVEKEITYFSREVQTVEENPEEQELKYSQDYVDTLIENNAILKEIIAEKDEEIQALTQSKISQNRLSKVGIKALNPETEINQDNVEKEVQVCIEDEDNELSFKLTKSKDLVRRYQDFFEDLQSSYSLPENLISEIEKLQDEYADLFAGNHISSKEFWNDNQTGEADEYKQTESEPAMHTLESYDEPIPVKDSELEVSHVKHKGKIPVLDLSKVQMLSDSDEGEEEEEENEGDQEQYIQPSVSSDDDPEALIQALNDDDDPGEEYRLGTDEANQLDSADSEGEADIDDNHQEDGDEDDSY